MRFTSELSESSWQHERAPTSYNVMLGAQKLLTEFSVPSRNAKFCPYWEEGGVGIS